MKILIHKYQLGLCNDQEKALIEDWLQGRREEILPLIPLHFNAYKIENRIWKKLKKSTIHKAFITQWIIGLVACAFILWLIACLPHE